MTSRTIYLDNAATTFPKPETVYKAQDKYSRQAANPGRGAHKPAMDCARVVFDVRTAAADLLGIRQAERLIFTPSCTYSINMALKGMSWRAGDVIVVSAMEHNAVMRPLRQLERDHKVRIVGLPYASKGIVDIKALISLLLQHHPKLCIFTEASNVTGEMIDLQAVAAICGAHKVKLMIDAAQTAGRNAKGLDQLGVSIWCASAHKGLFGLPGVGLLYVSPDVDLQPVIAGGTGSQSQKTEMPESYPDRLEAGTLPGPAIAALGAGITYLKQAGVKAVADAEQDLTRRFLDWAQTSGSVKVYGNRNEGRGTAVVSFDVKDIPCDRVAELLDTNYLIAVRSGLHCAPFAHNALGTFETGLVRASFSYFNTVDDVDALCSALREIAANPAMTSKV